MSKFIQVQGTRELINVYDIRRVYIGITPDDSNNVIWAELRNDSLSVLCSYDDGYIEAVFDEIKGFLSNSRSGCYECPDAKRGVEEDGRYYFEENPFL